VLIQTHTGSVTPGLADLRVAIYADGADLDGIKAALGDPLIAGFTTNPTLMRKAGIVDYEQFAHDVLRIVVDRPISLEVFADTEAEMERQAHKIATWGKNVFVKIPVTNTQRVPTTDLVHRLSHEGVQLNVTALMTTHQVADVTAALAGGAPAFISVFAGRIADTGRDPLPMMKRSLEIMRSEPQLQLIWASPRELLNVFHADSIGCHVITVTADVLAKLKLVGKNLDDYSLETVRMFHEDAARAAYSL
jgi:transaldolase